MGKYKTKEISSIHEFVEFVEREKRLKEKSGNDVDFLFRGQRRDLPLKPKLGRLKLRGEIEKVEELILKEFKRTSLPLTEFEPKNEWDWIALAQHHGLPTRLLDWTYSSLIALWYAVNEAPYKNINGDIENGVVWLFIPEQKDFEIDTTKLSPLSNMFTKIFRPDFISRRISAQSGLFTIHKIVKVKEELKFITFEEHIRFRQKLIKIIIPADIFSQIRKQLHILGINHSTVLPEIDGLCKHLEWRYSFLEDE